MKSPHAREIRGDCYLNPGSVRREDYDFNGTKGSAIQE
jgi:hypothetical protein